MFQAPLMWVVILTLPETVASRGVSGYLSVSRLCAGHTAALSAIGFFTTVCPVKSRIYAAAKRDFQNPDFTANQGSSAKLSTACGNTIGYACRVASAVNSPSRIDKQSKKLV